MDRVPNQALAAAALEAMRASGKPLAKIQTGTRSMKYAMQDGRTVRLRTCNDPVLVVLASSTEEDATLNIEGTDYLLVVMPETPRQPGPVITYFLPAEAAARDVRRAHADWLASGPATKGNNRTWNIWFNEGPKGCSDFALRWGKYRLATKKSEASASTSFPNRAKQDATLGAVIAQAKADIAAVAGVPIEAVKISVVLD